MAIRIRNPFKKKSSSLGSLYLTPSEGQGKPASSYGGSGVVIGGSTQRDTSGKFVGGGGSGVGSGVTSGSGTSTIQEEGISTTQTQTIQTQQPKLTLAQRRVLGTRTRTYTQPTYFRKSVEESQADVVARRKQLLRGFKEEREGKVRVDLSRAKKGTITITRESEKILEGQPQQQERTEDNKKLISKTINTLFNEEKAIVVLEGTTIGLGLPTGSKFGYTFKDPLKLKDIKEVYRTGGTTGKVIGEFIPTTYAGAVTFVGVGGIYGKLPSIARAGTSAYFSYRGIKTTLDINQPTETRIAGGIVGGLGAVGTTAEAIPYVRGVTARISPEYKPVVTAEQGFKAIELKETRVGLIPEKYPLKTGETANVKLPESSPLVRGGFHRRVGGESIFLGKNQYLATSQRGLFKEGKEIPLEKEFFVTPQEPFMKIPETRVSRLGLTSPFEIPKGSELGMGLPPQPQIGVTIGEVRRVETNRAYKLGTGTELEATKTSGTIKNVRQIGVTSIKGQGVKLYSFDLGEGQQGTIRKQQTTRISSRVSAEGILSTELQKTRTTQSRIPTPPTTTRTITNTLRITSIPTITKAKSQKISPPISPSVTIPIYPTRSPPTNQRVTIPIYPTRSPTIIPSIPTTKRTYKPRRIKSERSSGGFSVYIRRFGKFKPIGFGLTLKQAFGVGGEATQKTLARSFQVRGGSLAGGRFPEGYRIKQERTGITFIEPSKQALNTSSELRSLLSYKKNKKQRFL